MKPMAAKLYRSMRNLMVKLGWLSTWYYGHDGIIYIRVLYICVCGIILCGIIWGNYGSQFVLVVIKIHELGISINQPVHHGMM